MSDLAKRLQAEVDRMMAERETILCVVLTDTDFRELTGKNAADVSDFGAFLGVPIRLGDRTHVRATLPFRLAKRNREGVREGSGDV